MIDAAFFVGCLERSGIDFFAGVPDSLLKAFCAHVAQALPASRHVVTANEGAAVGLAMGHYLKSGRPALVYMQNSGIGNAVNPLVSLADREVYGIPMLLLVGWRGQPGVKDEPQHVKQGRIMTSLLDALEIPWTILPSEEREAETCLVDAVRRTCETQHPVAVLVRKDTFAETAIPAVAGLPDLPSREEALGALLQAIGPDAIQVSTTGMLSREVFEYRQKQNSIGRDFLTVGGMGHCSAIALGIAQQEAEREVWCLDGDGALLMHLGGLPVIGARAPRHFFHVLFNNGVHDSVGGQPIGNTDVDFVAIAKASGYRTALRTSDLADVAGKVQELRQSGGPSLLELQVRPGNRPDIGRPSVSPREAKVALMTALRGSAS